MATFRNAGTIHAFREKFLAGMRARGYDADFAVRCFRQIEGFADYGFPESHAASFALIVYVSVVPDPLNPLLEQPAWLYGFVVRDRGVVFSMIMMAIIIMTFSPRLILWFGFWLFVSWCGAIWWLMTRPGVIVSQHFGDEWNPTQQEIIDTYNLPEFVDISALAEQVIIVIVFTLACAVMVSRLRVLINQSAASERAHGNLARYFPTALADQLADRDEPVRVGERRECVILFADVIGFSRFAEKRDPVWKGR